MKISSVNFIGLADSILVTELVVAFFSTALGYI